MSQKILLIEDDDSIRRLIEYDLNQLGYKVTACASGQEGLEKALNGSYDLLLVDWMLPNVSGIEIVQSYRDAGNHGIVMMVTAKSAEEDLLDAFKAGIDDYMTKPFSPRELGARIQAHFRRVDSIKEKRQLEYGNLSLDLDLHYVYINEEKVDLTRKEFDLLILLIQNMDEVLSRDEILNKIWNFSYDGDTRIVDVHIFKLRNKIQDADVIIDSLRGVGYVAKIK